jgi:hypothetical protein
MYILKYLFFYDIINKILLFYIKIMPESIFTLKIFHGIDKDIIKNIINNSKVREYEDGEMIVMESEASNGEGYIIKT